VPTTLFVLGRLQSTVSCRVRSLVPWFDLCALPCFLGMSPGPCRAGIPGRLIPVGSDRASRRRAVSRGWAYPQSDSAGSESEVVLSEAVLLARPSGRRGRPEAGW